MAQTHTHLHQNNPEINAIFISVLRTTVSPAFRLYGSLIRVWVLMFPFFAILKPEDLQVVLSSRKHTEKIFFYKLLHNFLGNGLITSSGEFCHRMKDIRSAIIKLFLSLADTWSLHRRLIQPTFHMNILETFVGTFVDASNLLVKRLKDGPNELNITHMVNQCVIDILNGEFSI